MLAQEIKIIDRLKKNLSQFYPGLNNTHDVKFNAVIFWNRHGS
jgi:hypothetical protein